MASDSAEKGLLTPKEEPLDDQDDEDHGTTTIKVEPDLMQDVKVEVKMEAEDTEIEDGYEGQPTAQDHPEAEELIIQVEAGEGEEFVTTECIEPQLSVHDYFELVVDEPVYETTEDEEEEEAKPRVSRVRLLKSKVKKKPAKVKKVKKVKRMESALVRKELGEEFIVQLAAASPELASQLKCEHCNVAFGSRISVISHFLLCHAEGLEIYSRSDQFRTKTVRITPT